MILAWSLLLINLAPAPSPVHAPASGKRATTTATGIQRGALLDPFAEHGPLKKHRPLPPSPGDKGLKDPFAAPQKPTRNTAKRAKIATAEGPLIDPFSIAPGMRAVKLRISGELKDPFGAPKQRPGRRKAALSSPEQVRIQRLPPSSTRLPQRQDQPTSPPSSTRLPQRPDPPVQPPSSTRLPRRPDPPAQAPSPSQVPIQRPKCRAAAAAKPPCPAPPQGAGSS
ncbi:MAG TPA: hypothetical protein ENK31_05310 [Nannocystis exedens]|nr:hypothetical protein [Nannocystis exedens]